MCEWRRGTVTQRKNGFCPSSRSIDLLGGSNALNRRYPLHLPNGRRDRMDRGRSRRRLGTLAGTGDVLARCRRVARPWRAVYTS